MNEVDLDKTRNMNDSDLKLPHNRGRSPLATISCLSGLTGKTKLQLDKCRGCPENFKVIRPSMAALMITKNLTSPRLLVTVSGIGSKGPHALLK